ncbi:proton-conducting transporter membrane subunit [Macrococcus lamae]|nr:proton-conducting transporter membrane subunit [Macrococcus lamae]
MNNLLLIPLIVPLLTGIILFIYPHYQRLITIIVLTISSILSLYLTYYSAVNGTLVINFGGWKPPYGIQFAGDVLSLSLSSISLLVTALVLLYGYHRPLQENVKLPFILFLLVGVNGSFLTSDIFNLFVQFEVMLLASFVLLAIGNRTVQLKASIPYVVINIVGSWVFLIAIGLTYRTYGTLNFAQLSERVASVGMTDYAIIIALLYLLVFSLKSALLLFMWLPKSYAVLSTENSAIFSALLTKVGVYALLRIFTVIFSVHSAVTHQLILYMSIITMIIGCIGVLAYRDIKYMICYQIILSIGIIIFGLATDSDTGLSGAVLYLLNDMLIKALLFLVAGTIIHQLHVKKIKENKGLIKSFPVLGILFFIVTLTIGGVPPFGGFPGKLMIVQAGLMSGLYISTMIMIVTSIISLYTLLRMFIKVFLGEPSADKAVDKIHTHQYVAMISLLILSLCISFFANPLIELVQTIDNDIYTDTMMSGGKK